MLSNMEENEKKLSYDYGKKTGNYGSQEPH